MSENNSSDDELRRFAEQGMQGAWHLCPQCMSKDVWKIKCEYKNMRTLLDENENGKLFDNFTVGSMCEKCGFVELAPDMKDLGMDKIDWKLVANKRETYPQVNVLKDLFVQHLH